MKFIVKSLFPTTFSNNWYITCYLLFYPIYPLLNMLIEKMKQRELLRVAMALFLINFVISYVKGGLVFGVIASMIYDKSIRLLVKKINSSIYESAKNIYLKIENYYINRN